MLFSEVLNFNSYLAFPVITILHFSFFISYELEKGTIYDLRTSIYSHTQIFFAKFLYSIISFSLVFVPANVLLLLYTYIADLNTEEFIGMSLYSWYSILGVFFLTVIMLIIHFVTIGSVTLIINTIGFKQNTTFILSFLIFLLLRIVPIPNFLEKFTFINGATVSNNLLNFENVIYINGQIALSSIIFIIIFFYMGEFIFVFKQRS
ncbi:hypothetical protein [Alkalibacterium sp. 20]|uniref:hypothetical protein n=1 Tax=Alkalibacterium sp. 20 TaxID=1798803 RepID=UPI0009000005|nr:hypothetical protein [Alkalibacterium sp. 20]OJF91682.1 hypothetical protein AX762_10885 [Alkalibacterium sp. 20]